MPGALIIESMAQSAGTLVMYSLKKNQENISVYLLTVDKAKFRKPVCPGDTLFHRVVKKQNVKNIWKFKCTSFVNEKLVAEAEVSAIINSIIWLVVIICNYLLFVTSTVLIYKKLWLVILSFIKIVKLERM